MLAINTINDYFSLTPRQQAQILNGIKTKERLNTFLEKRNKLREPTKTEVICKNCKGQGKLTFEERVDTDTDYHASSISSCMRKIYFDVTGNRNKIESNIDAQSFLTMDIGNAIHDLIQGYGYQGAFCDPKYYEAEVPIEPNLEIARQKNQHILKLAEKYKVRSHVDAWLWSVEVNTQELGNVSTRLGHEYKTIGDKGFNELTGPKQQHIEQTTIYNILFDIPIMVYIYINLDTKEIKDFPVPVNIAAWREISQKIDTIEEYKRKGEIPPFEESSAMKNPIECNGMSSKGKKTRYSPCKYYNKLCFPDCLLKNISKKEA
jgi:hypothetical protein